MIDYDAMQKYRIKSLPTLLQKKNSTHLGSLVIDSDNKEYISSSAITSVQKGNKKTLAGFSREYGIRKLQSSIIPLSNILLSGEESSNNSTISTAERMTPSSRDNMLPLRNEDMTDLSMEAFGSMAALQPLSLSSLSFSSSLLRIYRNDLAERLTKFYGADALTIGRNLYFSPTKLNLSSLGGIALLVHEITHLMQQERNPDLVRAGKNSDNISLSQYSELEKEAQDAERNFLKLSALFQQYNLKNLPGYRIADSTREYKTSTAVRHPPEDLYYLANTSSISYMMRNMFKGNLSEFVKASFQNSSHTSQAGSDGLMSSPVRALSYSSATPFLAQEGRSVNLPAMVSLTQAITPGEELPPPAVTTPDKSSVVDVGRLADQVYDIIVGRLKMERDRRGIR